MTYIAMLILVPSLFVQRPLRMIVLTCLFDAIFIVGCVFIKSAEMNMFMNKNEYYKNLARTARKENY
ncbi:MAG: hypothetical protein Q4F58_02415 [Candidatus Saccharibacteria bacterium]|nr:hypothetical protein [Candidatus Saccharibacteria bacterium]